MSVTILEALKNANHNFSNIPKIGMVLFPIVKEQLNNAVILLGKGYGLNDEVEPLLEKYGGVDNVPEKIKEN